MWFSQGLPCLGLLEILKSVCWDFFFPIKFDDTSSNIFLPSLSPSRIPIKRQITWYDLSHGTEALFTFFFHSLFQFEWLLPIYLKVHWYFFYRAQAAVESSDELFISDTVFFGPRISIWLFLKFPLLHSNSYLLSHYVSMSLYLMSFFLFAIGHTAYMSCDFFIVCWIL